MAARKHFFTSESVGEGHPDKVCDQISDAILDDVLRQDPYGRVACETYVTMGLLIVGGEITTTGFVDVHNLTRNVLKEIGYTHPKYGFDYHTCAVINTIHSQSPDIAQGVNKGGAGDQGCLKKGTLVRTAKGFLPIEEIRSGDLVVTPYGLKKVLKMRKTGIKEIIEVKFSNGMRLECTPEHKILCYSKKGQTYWQMASNLTQKDFVCTLKHNDSFPNLYIKSRVNREDFFTKYNHKLYGPEEVILDEKLGYIVGLLIGDGHIKNKNFMEIAFGRDLKHALMVKQILDKKFHRQWRVIRTKEGMINLKIDSLLARRHFENLGVSYSKSPQKTTPQAILISPAIVNKAYLRGLFDSDGTIVNNTGRKGQNIKIRLGSSSYRLLQETQLLLNEFRIKSSIVFNGMGKYKTLPLKEQEGLSFLDKTLSQPLKLHKESPEFRLWRDEVSCCPEGTPIGKDKNYKSNYDSFTLNLVGFESYQNFAKDIGFSHPQKAQKLKIYLKDNRSEPKNSRSIFLIPHPYKEEMIGEELIGKNLPFGTATLKSKVKKGKAEVYDLEIHRKNIFSANGVFVHNSMFGYACRETPELMPLPIMLAHKLVRRIADVRKQGILKYLGPDCKSQVTIEYHDGHPKRVDSCVLACQHTEEILDTTKEKITKKARQELIDVIAKPILKEYIDRNTKYYVNETGKFVTGGPQSDTGMTGRKLMVDNYGGSVPVGGGSFSGKDPTKVDRSAAYMTRYIAKNIVAVGLADKCLIQLAYVIGRADPLAIMVDTGGTGKLSESAFIKLIRDNFELTPQGMIKELDLLRPIYRKTACYGHFGRTEPEFSWESTDKAAALKKQAARL